MGAAAHPWGILHTEMGCQPCAEEYKERQAQLSRCLWLGMGGQGQWSCGVWWAGPHAQGVMWVRRATRARLVGTRWQEVAGQDRREAGEARRGGPAGS